MPNGLISNRVTEHDIRTWLSDNGFAGASAKFVELELHAVGRPGWLQIFRFTVNLPQPIKTTKSNVVHSPKGGPSSGEIVRYGVVRDDERQMTESKRCEISIYDDPAAQTKRLDELSRGLLTCRTGQNGSLMWGLAVIAAIFGMVLTLNKLF